MIKNKKAIAKTFDKDIKYRRNQQMIPIGDNRKRDKERTKEKRIDIGPAGRE